MNNYNRLVNNLEEMKLTAMKDNLDHMIEQNAKGEVNFTEGLYQLTQYQIEEKREKESEIIRLPLLQRLPASSST